MEEHTTLLQADEVEVENAPAIFREEYKRIFRYVVSMVQDSAEAEDLTQETFLRAYRRRDSLRDKGAQTAWLYRIATNVCYDRMRRYTRRAPMESDADLDEIDVVETDVPSLQKTIERHEMSACVQRYLNELPDNYRAVILLHDMHELTAPEIALLLGESLSTVKIRIHRARRKLRMTLEASCAFSRDERDALVCESKQ